MLDAWPTSVADDSGEPGRRGAKYSGWPEAAMLVPGAAGVGVSWEADSSSEIRIAPHADKRGLDAAVSRLLSSSSEESIVIISVRLVETRRP